MGKRAILLFYRRNRLLLAFFSAVFIQLPQYIDSVWSLAEHASREGSSMSASWLYWVTVPVGLGMLLTVFRLTRKPVLSDAEKPRVTELMETVNALDDRMTRYFDKALTYKKNRVVRYQGMLDQPEFRSMWDKCLKQRVEINTISPKLGEQVRLLLTLIQASHRFLLKDWYVSELPKFRRTVEEHTKIAEDIRKRIKKTNEELMI